MRTIYPANGSLIVDPYNDFLSEGGKLWPKVKATADAVGLIEHLRALVGAARQSGIIVFHVPHRRWHEGDCDGWLYPNPAQLTGGRTVIFADGTWGGEWHPDLVPNLGMSSSSRGQNGFANTDLDLQLKQRGIDGIIIVGMLANTCVEGTARCGVEIGYHVTLVRDATAAFSREAMRAAHRINGPSFVHAS